MVLPPFDFFSFAFLSASRSGFDRVSVGVFIILILPRHPATEKRLYIVIAEVVVIVKRLRHTGAVFFIDSVTVGDNKLIFGEIAYAIVYLILRKGNSAFYRAFLVVIFFAHVNNHGPLGGVII